MPLPLSPLLSHSHSLADDGTLLQNPVHPHWQSHILHLRGGRKRKGKRGKERGEERGKERGEERGEEGESAGGEGI